MINKMDSNNNSKSPYLPRIFRFLGGSGIVIVGLVGILAILVPDRVSPQASTICVKIFLASLLFIGFSYIVHAAMIYIELHQPHETNSPEENQ